MAPKATIRYAVRPIGIEGQFWVERDDGMILGGVIASRKDGKWTNTANDTVRFDSREEAVRDLLVRRANTPPPAHPIPGAALRRGEGGEMREFRHSPVG